MIEAYLRDFTENLLKTAQKRGVDLSGKTIGVADLPGGALGLTDFEGRWILYDPSVIGSAIQEYVVDHETIHLKEIELMDEMGLDIVEKLYLKPVNEFIADYLSGTNAYLRGDNIYRFGAYKLRELMESDCKKRYIEKGRLKDGRGYVVEFCYDSGEELEEFLKRYNYERDVEFRGVLDNRKMKEYISKTLQYLQEPRTGVAS